MAVLDMVQNMYNGLFILPIACALVCWLFACLLIYYFFSPLQPVKILGISIQGYLPAKQDFFVRSVSEKIELLLLQQKEQIKENIISQENLEKIMPEMEKHIDEFLTVKLPQDIPMLSMFIGEKTIHQIKEVFMKELRVLFPKILSTYLDKMLKPGNIQKLLKEKISNSSVSTIITGFKKKNASSFTKIKILASVFGLIAGSLLSFVIFLFT